MESECASKSVALSKTGPFIDADIQTFLFEMNESDVMEKNNVTTCWRLWGNAPQPSPDLRGPELPHLSEEDPAHVLHRLPRGKSRLILTPLWTGKSPEIINPPVSKASFKRHAKSHKKKERCASITITCGWCDSCCQPLFVIPGVIRRVFGA